MVVDIDVDVCEVIDDELRVEIKLFFDEVPLLVFMVDDIADEKMPGEVIIVIIFEQLDDEERDEVG